MNIFKFTMLSILSLFLLNGTNLYANDVVKNNRRIVILKSGVNPDQTATSVALKHGVAKGHVYKHAVKGFSISLPDAAVNALRKDKRIKYIVNDTPKKISSTPNGISRTFATKNAAAAINNDGGNVDIDVAVIDTGIDLTHPRLNVYRSVKIFLKNKLTH